MAKFVLMGLLFVPALVFAQSSASNGAANQTSSGSGNTTQTAATCTIVATPSTIVRGGSIRLSWMSFNSTTGAISGIGSVATTGVLTLSPTATYNFVGTFSGPLGSVSCNTTVFVTQPNGTTGSGSGSGSGSGNNPGTTPGYPTYSSEPSYPSSPDPVPPGSLPAAGSRTNGTTVLGGASSNGTPASSATGGLVSCTGTVDCNLCTLVRLLQNLINFALGLTIPIAVALFAYSAFLLFTSQANPARVTLAKKIFKSALIGFLVALSAWLLVQTVLNVLTQGAQLTNWNWNQITCSGDRIGSSPSNSVSIAQWLSGTLPALNKAPNLPDYAQDTTGVAQAKNSVEQALIANCAADEESASCKVLDTWGDPNLDKDQKQALQDAAQDALQDACDDGDQNSCTALAQIINVTTIMGSNTDCSASNIQAAAASGGYTLTDAQAATLSCIAVPESACGRNTNIATTPSGNPTSATGMFQITFGAGNDQCHNLNIPICNQAAQEAGFQVSGNLNCYSTVSGGRPQGAAGQACVAAARNISCNASAAACLVAARGGGFSDWTADSRNSAQKSCIAKYN
jgi:hypothetical protein